MAERAGVFVPRHQGIATLPQRSIGLIVDGLVLGVAALLVRLVPGPIGHSALMDTVFSAAYFIPLIALNGVTLGCRTVGIRIGTAESASAPDWARSAARWAPRVVLGLVARALFGTPGWVVLTGLALLLIMYGPAMYDAQRRTLPDRLAGTVVRVVEGPTPW